MNGGFAMKTREWLTDRQAKRTSDFYEAIHSGMTYEEAFDAVIEYKLDDEIIKALEEDRVYYESTGETPPEPTEEERARNRARDKAICERYDVEYAKLEKRLYEIDNEAFTIVEVVDIDEDDLLSTPITG
jgi:hypothetical protein